MKTIDVDLETYSSVDLAKSGVYRYVESPDFEILLFGYSTDGGKVNVIDLTSGESLPSEIRTALHDDTVMKWAHNAQFERICLSRYLGMTTGQYLDPQSWRCTMVWCAYLGLPLSLAGASVVTGADKQKLSEGKDLIRYFCSPCKPTIVNDGRTRNLPTHTPEKWKQFKLYNVRDVETELSITGRLSKFPMPEDEWKNYVLDQKINDRGIRLDVDLVSEAIRIDTRSRFELTNTMQEITDLENPNSVAQMKAWLAENGMETDSLDKAAVKQLLKTAPENLGEVLMLRQDLAKSSIKKYTAMENAVCSDGRARGLLQFYGANRTGRFCLTGDHEILTKDGWLCLDQWQGSEIACWNPKGEIVSFQMADAVSFAYTGPMYEYSDKRISQISTPDHKMYVKRRYGGEWVVDTVKNITQYRPSIPFTGFRMTNSGLEHAYLRVLVMVQADGNYTSEGSMRLAFSKSRKIERCKELLRKADITYTQVCHKQNGKIIETFSIYARHVPLWLRLFKDKTFGSWLFDESPDVFFDELVYWDGYRSAVNSIQYSTCNKQNADMVQAFAHISGRSALLGIRDRTKENPGWRVVYTVDIWLTPKNCHEIRTKPTISEFDGQVYCAITSTGFFLVRRNGRVWVTGNSGRLIQVQNLPQNHLPDLAQARQLVKSGDYATMEALYDSVPAVLSELIRTAFVPDPGCKFIVADFSAIEARVIAWLAGERWRNEVFATHGKIYEASASQMFRVPIEEITKGSTLRQKGKIAELALGYGGSVGALKAMGALDMGLSEDELQPLVTAWRTANPNITRLWWDVDRAAMTAVRNKMSVQTHGIIFEYRSGFLFITLPSGRRLSYVKPRIGTNSFGSDSVTYEGVGATKKWERIETYGPKLVENVVQAISRDILCHAMRRLDSVGLSIVMTVHDEVVIEASPDVSREVACRYMGETPPWAKGLLLRADGFECSFYKKD
jgi:hypothetical protein